jgi:glycosyltransferase involved in cell wall biosynthesis
MMNNLNEGLAAGPVFLSHTMVVMPALNEFSCVAATVQAWQALGAGGVRVVDNGSSDDTAGAARKAGAQVLVEPVRGYGAAAWRGLQDWPADMDWVLFSSADGSDRLSAIELREWQAAVDGGADLIVGDRVTEKASRAELTFAQRLGNWITCEAIRVSWGKRFHDLGSLRLVRHRRLMSLGLADRGFGWNVEMQIRAIEHGWKIVELPVRYFPRQAGESKISGNLLGSFRAGSAILRMLGLLWMLRRRRTVPFGHRIHETHER